MEQEAKNKSILVEKELLKFTFKNLNDLYLNYCKKAENISENILKDYKLTTNVTDKDTLRNEFSTFNNFTYTEFGDILLNLDCLVNNDELIQIYNNETNEENKVLRDFSLKVFGKIRSEHLDVQCKKAVNDFAEKLKQKFEVAKSNFTKEEASKFESILKQDEKVPALGLFVGILCKSSNTDCGEELHTYTKNKI